MGAHTSVNATVSAHNASAVTPNDSTVIPTTRALYVGVSGNITVRMADNFAQGTGGDNILFVAVPVGILPIQVDKVYSTGTAATSIIALY